MSTPIWRPSPWNALFPCGIDDAGVTSLGAETGRHLSTGAPANALVSALENQLTPLVADTT